MNWSVLDRNILDRSNTLNRLSDSSSHKHLTSEYNKETERSL